MEKWIDDDDDVDDDDDDDDDVDVDVDDVDDVCMFFKQHDSFYQ